MSTGQVLYGINNIYTVEVDGRQLQCRIKGKVLKTERNVYNPIAVGDYVSLQGDPHSEGVGWIVERRERTSSLIRWNKKRNAIQVLAANADLLVCVSSTQSPPFRPRFIDRVLVSADRLQPLIVINKADLAVGSDIKDRIRDYRKIGYPVILTSALSGKGVGELRRRIKDRLAVFCGQSGVGKSTLLNRMFTGLDLAVGNISAKYDRGSHTTSFASLIRAAEGFRFIDTPGIRELEIAGVDARDLAFYFPEFVPIAENCSYPSCRHVDEPECAVQQAVEQGMIHPDRYESYLRIYEDVEAFAQAFPRSPYA
ncbi:MAG: ribosome small subunit-dependent GTPase A [Spirochaetaceae bacterium]|nr:MAG: ribosome small subunit-dependent GTPase A [Spirochaetaceae bacterium]